MHTATLATKSRTGGKDPATALLHQHDDGTIHARSTGTSPVVYVVTIGTEMSCTCPAGTRGITCYHQLGAAQRFPAFWPRPSHVIVPSNNEEPPPPAAPALGPVQCCTCGTFIAIAEAKVHDRFPGYWNHQDFEACRVARAGVRRQLGVA